MKKGISGLTSIILDLLRLGAALTVFFSHAEDLWYPIKKHNPNEPFDGAHTAVIIFFVLSGYVIGLSTSNNNRGFSHYAQARLSRLSSVLIPALVVTAIVEIGVYFLSPSLKAEFSRGFSLPRYFITGAFINEIWFFSSAPPINRPLWSLSFEFWYYAIFGLFYFKGAGKKSLILPLLACLIAGPKILLMMPIWLLGYFAYRIPKQAISKSTSIVLMIIAFILAGLAVRYLVPFPYPLGTYPFHFASQFLTDFVIGCCFAFGLWVMPGFHEVPINNRIVSWVRKWADLTFPIYVFHFPLFILWQALFSNNPVFYNVWVAILFVLLTCSVLGLMLDKQRKYWNMFFKWLIGNLKMSSLKLKGIFLSDLKVKPTYTD
ncbi:MAG: acyltransferase [Chitinophagaceae bacterium]|nr:acyltransferase [Chitinophagaceae bacterium]